jgi:hypothetical protein
MPFVSGAYSPVTSQPTIAADMALALTSLYQGAEPALQTITAATYSQLVTDGPITFNPTGTCTYTLLAAASNIGRLQWVRNISAFAINSATANVVPLAGGAAVTAILPVSAAGKWALLQATATNWQIIAGN